MAACGLGSSPPWPSAALLRWALYSWWLSNTAWGECSASGLGWEGGWVLKQHFSFRVSAEGSALTGCGNGSFCSLKWSCWWLDSFWDAVVDLWTFFFPLQFWRRKKKFFFFFKPCVVLHHPSTLLSSSAIKLPSGTPERGYSLLFVWFLVGNYIKMSRIFASLILIFEITSPQFHEV